MDVEIVKQLQSVTDKCKSAEHRIDKLEQQITVINELSTSIKVMAEKMTQFDVQLTKLDENVTQLNQKPAKRWDLIVAKIVEALAIAIVGYLIGQF